MEVTPRMQIYWCWQRCSLFFLQFLMQKSILGMEKYWDQLSNEQTEGSQNWRVSAVENLNLNEQWGAGGEHRERGRSRDGEGCFQCVSAKNFEISTHLVFKCPHTPGIGSCVSFERKVCGTQGDQKPSTVGLTPGVKGHSHPLNQWQKMKQKRMLAKT